MIVDLIAAVLDPAFRIEGDVVRSSFPGPDGKWHRLMFVVEDDVVYGIAAGTEYALCFTDPASDLEDWVKKLREGRHDEIRNNQKAG